MLRTFFILLLALNFVGVEAQQKLYPVRSGNMWGLMDLSGNLVVPAEYNSIGEYEEEGYAIAQKGDLLGVMDSLGNLTIPCKYEMMDYIGKGLYSIKEANNWKIINSNDKVILDSMCGKITFLERGYLTYEEISGTGLAHIRNGIILPPKYETFKFLRRDFIVAYDEEMSRSLFDTTGLQILPNGFERITLDNNWIWGKRSGKWGAYDRQGNVILPNQWAKYGSLGGSFYSLTDEDGKHFLYSTVLDSIIMSKQKGFYVFDSNYALFQDFHNKQGLVDVNGNIILEAEYDLITQFGANAFRVQKGDKHGVLDLSGNVLAPFVYDFIGNLKNQVTLAKKGKWYGVLNLNGELVLPAVYSKKISLNDNIARYKDTSGVLHMFIFDENGQLKKNTNFANLKSLKIRTASSPMTGSVTIAGGPAIDPYRLSDSLVWQFHPGSRKWGLWNDDLKRYKYTPQWDNVLVLKDVGITIVGKARSEIGGRLVTGRLTLKVHQVFGLFNNMHGLPISKMEFLDVRVSDFQVLGLDVARCVFIGGSHGLLGRNGRVVSRGYVYIGDFVEGKARATKKGKVLVDLDEKIKRPIMKARDYFRSLRSGFAFDNDDDPKLFIQFSKKGQLYCENAEWGFIDTFGQVHSKFKYDYVEDYTNNRSLVRNNGKWGMIDEDGNEVLAPQYDDFNFLKKADRQLFYVSNFVNLKGAIDSNANIIVPVKYNKVRDFQEDRVAVRDIYRKWGFVDRNAKEVIPAQYRLVNDFSEGLAVVYDKARWGAINLSGDVVIKPQYPRMGDFKEGKAWVMLKGGYKGYINPQGELLFKGKYSRLTDFKDSIARVYVRKKGWGLIDDQGNYILKPKKRFKKIEAFNDMGLAKVKVGKKYRLINQEGKFVGKKAYGLIREFKEGYAVVRVQALGGNSLQKTNLNFGFIDSTGELVTKQDFRQLQDFCEGRAAFTGESSKRGYINYKGEVVIEPEYFRVEDFKHNRAVVWASYNKTGVIDTTGAAIIPVKYNKIVDIKEGLALVRKNSWTYYFVHEDTKRHTPLNYQGAYAFEKRLAPVKAGDKWGVINEKGLKRLIPKYAKIDTYKDGVAKVSVHNLIGVVDINGKVIINPEYEYVSYAGDGLFRVERGDKMGYLDMNGNWVWEMK